MELKKYQAKSEFFSRKFELTQDVEMRSRSWSPMKVGQPRSNHIRQTFHIDHLTEEDKKIWQFQRIRLKQKWVFLLWGWYGQRGFRGWGQWERKPARSLTRLKQKEITEKLRSYYDAGISAEVITKDIHGLMPRTIYNHYRLFNEKVTNSRKKGSGRKYIITKDIGLKIKNLIKEDDLFNLEDIKKVLEKSKDKLILSKQTIERYLQKMGYTHDSHKKNINLLKSKKKTD